MTTPDKLTTALVLALCFVIGPAVREWVYRKEALWFAVRSPTLAIIGTRFYL